MLEAACSPAHLQKAWHRVWLNHGCAGVDRCPLDEYALALDENLSQLRARLLDGSYRPAPLRRFWLPKADGGFRPLGVPTVEDRIAQQLVAQAIGPLFERRFHDCSFAYRPGRSVEQALARVEKYRDADLRHVLDADIDECFDMLDHDVLLSAVGEVVSDARVLALIRLWVECPVADSEGLLLRERGVPQGAVISPLLCNVYLHQLDTGLLEQGFHLVRYADDFLVLCSSAERAQKADEATADALGALRLRLEPSKTSITFFDRGFKFLGATFQGDLCLVPERRHPYVRGSSVAPLPPLPSPERLAALWHEELLPLSALAAHAFCPRAFVLRYVWGLEETSAAMVQGTYRHAAAERRLPPGLAMPDGMVRRGVPVAAPELGVEGIIDAVIEKWGVVCPVEYKWSAHPRVRESHRVQVAAEAMALEEAWHTRITHAYVYFLPSGPRIMVPVDEAARNAVRGTIEAIGGLVESGRLPPVQSSPRCGGCPLVIMCRPQRTGKLHRRLADTIGASWG